MCVFTTGANCGQFDNSDFSDCTTRCFGFGFYQWGILPNVSEAATRSNVDYTQVIV